MICILTIVLFLFHFISICWIIVGKHAKLFRELLSQAIVKFSALGLIHCKITNSAAYIILFNNNNNNILKVTFTSSITFCQSLC